MTTFAIRITEEKLKELAMLADWQLRELGIDPDSVTVAMAHLRDLEHSDRLAAIE